MTYSIDTIPAKIYFKVLETEDFSLLSDDKEIDYEVLWSEIKSQAEQIRRTDNKNKVLDLSKEMQRFFVKHEAVNNAIYYLRRRRDEELEDLVRSFGYKLSNANFQKDLDNIERSIQSLHIKMSRTQKKIDELPKPKESSNSFEDIYMSYRAILEISLEPSDKILFLDFVAAEKQVTNKIKALSNHGKR